MILCMLVQVGFFITQRILHTIWRMTGRKKPACIGLRSITLCTNTLFILLPLILVTTCSQTFRSFVTTFSIIWWSCYNVCGDFISIDIPLISFRKAFKKFKPYNNVLTLLVLSIFSSVGFPLDSTAILLWN